MANRDLRRIAGALSTIWAGGDGPSKSKIDSALMIAGYDGNPLGTKQQVVQQAIAESDDATARKIIEELISLLDRSEYFDVISPQLLTTIERSFVEGGHELLPTNAVSWGSGEVHEQRAIPVDAREAARVRVVSVAPDDHGPPANPKPMADSETSSPDLGLLMATLRRLGMAAFRPLIIRRRADRAGISVEDEYDVQDLVESVLRSLYKDVRPEEFTPSSAGSASRMDFFLREIETSIEIKVTRPNHGEAPIKRELLVDINDYQGHPRVKTLICAVFDLADVFKNSEGFEHDLTRRHNDLNVHVLVVPWVGPRRPEPPAPKD